MNFLVALFIKSALAPALLGAFLVFLFGSAPEPWRARIQALIFAGVFACGFYVLSGVPPFPPQGGVPSLMWLGFWFAVYAWCMPRSTGVRYLVRAVWLLVALAISLWPLHREIFRYPMELRNLAAIALLALALWSVLERTAHRIHPISWAGLSAVSMTAASFLFLFRGSALLSQLTTNLAVFAALLALGAFVCPRRLSVHGVIPFLGGFFGVFLLVGLFYVEIRPWELVAMALPFLVLLICDLLPKISRSALVEAGVLAMVSGAPLAFLLWHIYKSTGPLY